jgi:hypothetical protein
MGWKQGGVVVGLACALAACMARVEPVVVAPPPVVARAPGLSWPREEVLKLAVDAQRCGYGRGVVDNSTLTVIDYSLPSSEKRLWVIDMLRWRVLFHEYVSHGEGSGEKWAFLFSNDEGSHQSSLGLFRTADTYVGGYGYSLRLDGLEPGVNDRARERKIVMHGALYASPWIVQRIGQLGTSHGCPTLPREVARTVIDRIKGGSAVFAYYPNPDWLARSEYLSCGGGMRVATR